MSTEAPARAASEDPANSDRIAADGSATDQPATDQPATGRATDGRRWLIVLAVVLGFAAHVAWRWWLARSVSSPVAHADEDRYLLSARALAGGPGGLGNDTTAFRRMGYPLFLTPVYWFTNDPWKVYHAAQALGGLVNALTFPLGYLFARRVLHTGRWIGYALAFVAATLPAVAYYSEFTLTDVLFGPIGLAWLLLLHGWLTARTLTGRVACAIGSAAVVGYAYVVHVRGLLMLVVYIGFVAVVVLMQRLRWKVAAAALLTAVLVTRLDWLAQRLIGDELVHGGVPPQVALKARFTDAGELVQMLCDAAGQIWYAAVGTYGLMAAGLVVAWWRVRGNDRAKPAGSSAGGVERSPRSSGPASQPAPDWAQRMTLAAALATVIVIALGSAAALPEDNRVSNHAYFRYIAFLAPVFLMVAGSALIGAGRRYALRVFFGTLTVTAVTGFLVLSQMTSGENFERFDTPEVAFLTNTWNNFPAARAMATALALLFVICLLIATTAPRITRTVAIALVAVLALNLGGMELINANSTRKMSDAQYGTGFRLERDLRITPDDVVVSSRWVSMGARLNHQREVYWSGLPEFDHRRGDAPPGDATVVFAPYRSRNFDDWDGDEYGFVLAASDPGQEYGVWFRKDDPRLAPGAISAGNGVPGR